MLFQRRCWQEDADRGSVLGGCLAAPDRDVPVVFFCQLLHDPEAEARTGLWLRSVEREKSLIYRFRIESFTVVENGHSHSRMRGVPPVLRFGNPQLDRSVSGHGIKRVRHQVREYLTNLALARQQDGAVADLC